MMNSEAQKKPVYISQIVIKILSYAVLICGCLMVLIPIVVILLGAFKDSKEFANLIFNEEKDVDEIHAILKEKHPGIAYGYVPPADGRERPKFM